VIERPARLLGGGRIALDGQLIALGTDIDAELLLQPGQILIELAV
jgi:hypothetical protein